MFHKYSQSQNLFPKASDLMQKMNRQDGE